MRNIEKELRDIYNEKQRINGLKNQEERNKILEKYEDIKDLEFNLISKNKDKALLLIDLDKDDEKVKDIERQIEELKFKRQELFKKYNLKDDCLDMHYDCPICKDTGYVDGKRCECLKKIENQLIKDELNIDMEEASFEKLNLKVYNQKIKGINYIEYIKNAFADLNEILLKNKGENKPINILINGLAGTGKTYIAKCFINDFIEREKEVLYITSDELINQTFKGTENVDRSKTCDLLVIDNLGNENKSDFSKNLIFNLIDLRLLSKKSTILVATFTQGDLTEFYGENFGSRLNNYFYELTLRGDDLRRLRNV